MAALFILFNLFRHCKPYLCSGCSRPYIFYDYTGVGACPTGYNLIDSSCIMQEDQIIIIDTEFNSVTSFKESICDVFQTNSGSFETIGNPFPTLDRGFYFPQNSYLKTNFNFIPSPRITFDIWVRVLSYGDIITIDGDTPYLRLGLDADNSLYFHYRYCNSSNICDLVENTNFLNITYEGSWISAGLFTEPSELNNSRSIFFLYDIEYTGKVFSGENSVSVSNQSEVYTWTVGHSTSGFKGFFYRLRVTNTLQKYWIDNIYISSCNPFYYFDQVECSACLGCLTSGLWCVRSSDCSPCYNNFCSSCNGYTIDECTEWSGQCSGGCLECSDFTNCSICHLGYIKVKYDWGTACEEDLQFSLLSSKLSTFILSGSNSDTDNANDLALDNPLQVPGRGYYFDGDGYLTTSTKVFIPHTFCIYMWIYPYEGTILTKQNSFEMNLTHFVLYIKSYDHKENILSIEYNMGLTTWQYAAIEVYYLNSFVELKAAIEGSDIFAKTAYNIFFDSIDEALILGYGFIGYISIFGIASKVHHSDTYNSNYMYETHSAFLFKQNDCQFIDGTACSASCYICEECSAINSLLCLACKKNFFLNSDGICVCPFSYILDSSLNTCLKCEINCEACHSSCLLCSGPGPKECYTCKSGLYIVEGYCMACPSLSVLVNDTICEVFLGQVFVAKFNTLLGIVYDELNKVPIITGNSEVFYPKYDSEDPVATYDRGFYFNGKSSVIRLPEYTSWKSPKLVLSLNWTIEIWLNPKSDSGCFFSYIGPDYSLISLCFLYTNISVSINSTLFSTYAFDIFSNLTSWKVLMVSYEYNDVSSISVFIDDIEQSIITFNHSVVPNYLSNTLFEIGKWKTNYFKGFIYQVSAYSKTPNYYEKSHFYCEGYLIEYCLVDCDIEKFYIGPGVNDCSLCHNSCLEGCIRNDSCSLCHDPLCNECLDFSSGSCSKCASITLSNGECGCADGTVLDYEVNECTVCGEKRYYNLFTCVNCSNFCNICDDGEKCLKCVDNASMEDSQCSCNLGYNGTTDCNEANFEAQIIVSEKNEIYIQFDDILLTDLDTSYMTVNTSKVIVESVKIDQWTSKIYKLKLTYSSAIPKYTFLTIVFEKEIYSIYNSKLSIQVLENELKSEDASTIDELLIAESESASSSVAVASTAATFSFSFANPNPACLWSFINTIQMLCFISLTSIPLGPRFSGYLKGLRKYNMIPNIFSYFVPHTDGKKPFKRAYEFGYKDHLLLFNIGNYITAFLIMICLFFIIFILSKLSKYKPFSYEFIRKKISSSLANYKYGAFIRFWITCYLDTLASALIGLITTESFKLLGIINFIFCFIFIVIAVLTPILFFYFTFKKKSQISDQNNEIQASWGTLFYEFNNDKGLSSSQFYFYFFIRRILYIIIQIFLQDTPIVQVSLNITLSVCNFVYLAFFRPFSERVLNISNCVSEFAITMIFTLICIDFLNIPRSFSQSIDITLVVLINIVMAVQMLASLYVFLRTVGLILKNKCNGSKLVLPEPLAAAVVTNVQTKQIQKELS